jgi:uncharacterized membrane protein YciS (DUF1049 family)
MKATMQTSHIFIRAIVKIINYVLKSIKWLKMIIKNIWYFVFILLKEQTKRTVFHVQVYDLDETTLLQDTINFTNPYIYISNLTSAKTYFLRIWTTNLFGKSEEINLTVTTKNSNDSSMNFLLKNTRIFVSTLFLTIIIFSILFLALISIYIIQKIRSILVSRKRRRKIREKREDKLMENLLRDLNNEKHVFNSCNENSNIQYFSNENKFLVIKFCSDDESNASVSYRSNSTIETTVSYEKKFLNPVFIYLNVSVKFKLSFFLLCLFRQRMKVKIQTRKENAIQLPFNVKFEFLLIFSCFENENVVYFYV